MFSSPLGVTDHAFTLTPGALTTPMEQRRWPASVLVAVLDLATASFIESTLSRSLDFPVWVWHETDVRRACQASNAFQGDVEVLVAVVQRVLGAVSTLVRI